METAALLAFSQKTEYNTQKLLNANASFTFQVGANDGQTITIKVSAMNATALGVNQVSIGTATAASSALSTIDTAITAVSAQRAKFGAVQNRLEHTIQNVDNSAENLQSAESRIRDTDMAKEMMEFTRTNVLSQATQSMLAQANQKPNQVLSLLQ